MLEDRSQDVLQVVLSRWLFSGVNYIPFMRLSTSDRRAVVETLLDIDIFSAMNTIIKARLSQSKDSIKDIDYKVDIVRTKIETQERLIKDIQSRSDDAIEAQNESQTAKDIDRIEKEITDIEIRLKNCSIQVRIRQKYRQHIRYKGINQRLKRMPSHYRSR